VVGERLERDYARSVCSSGRTYELRMNYAFGAAGVIARRANYSRGRGGGATGSGSGRASSCRFPAGTRSRASLRARRGGEGGTRGKKDGPVVPVNPRDKSR